MMKTHQTPARKPAPACETHQTIDDQVQLFLDDGGAIQSYPLGATAQAGISTHEFTVHPPQNKARKSLH